MAGWQSISEYVSSFTNRKAKQFYELLGRRCMLEINLQKILDTAILINQACEINIIL
jgi:hypothetical protein